VVGSDSALHGHANQGGGENAERVGGSGHDRQDERAGPPVAFWYRFGDAPPRVIRAADERAALEAVRARHPEAVERIVRLEPFGS
jgi:hypothetical protein